MTLRSGIQHSNRCHRFGSHSAALIGGPRSSRWRSGRRCERCCPYARLAGRSARRLLRTRMMNNGGATPSPSGFGFFLLPSSDHHPIFVAGLGMCCGVRAMRIVPEVVELPITVSQYHTRLGGKAACGLEFRRGQKGDATDVPRETAAVLSLCCGDAPTEVFFYYDVTSYESDAAIDWTCGLPSPCRMRFV